MIHVINYGYAISDEGFRIKHNYFYVSYAEDNYGLRIPIKTMSNKPYVFIIDFNHMTGWFPPHENEAISLEKKNKL